MNNLQVVSACTVVRLRPTSEGVATLVEQAAVHIQQNPLLLLDVEEIDFTSMNIGELLNLAQAFKEAWEPKYHRLGLINLAPGTQKSFKAIKLDSDFPFFDSVAEALLEIDRP